MAAEAEAHITQGVLEAIFNDPEHVQERFPAPVMQCLQIRPLESNGPGAAKRYRVILSDMKNYIQCMLASQITHVVHEETLQTGAIVQIKSYQANVVKGKRILIILDLEVLQSLGLLDKLGKPVPFTSEGDSAQPQQPANTTIGGTGFYGVKTEDKAKPQGAQHQQQQQQQQQHGGRTMGGAGGPTSTANGVIYPIEALTPYAHNKWTIKARVTSKSDIKYWHKASTQGKLFSVNLLDESGEIKATAFQDQVDQFYDVLQVGSVYYISAPCKVSFAKKQFSTLPNDYELTLERDTVIEKAEDQGSIPEIRFNFCLIQDLQNVEKDATVDVIGVLKDVGEVSQITSKTSGKPFEKRELTLVDDTNYSVRVTIWGKTATSFDANPESVVAFKGLKVSDFGGRSLSLLSSGTMAVDPDIPDAHRLKGWYDSTGRTDSFNTHSSSMLAATGAGAGAGSRDQTKTIAQIKEEQLGMDAEKADFFNLQATIVYIRQENFCYPACSNEGCNKKVTEDVTGTGWRCERCEVTHPRPRYRYIMSVSVNDHTGHIWLSVFDDVGRIVMGGLSADDLMALRDEDDAKFQAAFEKAYLTKLNFGCKAKTDTFQDTPRVRYQVTRASLIDYKVEADKLVELIKQYGVSA